MPKYALIPALRSATPKHRSAGDRVLVSANCCEFIERGYYTPIDLIPIYLTRVTDAIEVGWTKEAVDKDLRERADVDLSFFN